MLSRTLLGSALRQSTQASSSSEALEIWHVIDPGTNVKRSQDRQAMSALLRSVPKEMWQMLGNHKTVKEAWEAVQTMCLGTDQVKEVNA